MSKRKGSRKRKIDVYESFRVAERRVLSGETITGTVNVETLTKMLEDSDDNPSTSSSAKTSSENQSLDEVAPSDKEAPEVASKSKSPKQTAKLVKKKVANKSAKRAVQPKQPKKEKANTLSKENIHKAPEESQNKKIEETSLVSSESKEAPNLKEEDSMQAKKFKKGVRRVRIVEEPIDLVKESEKKKFLQKVKEELEIDLSKNLESKKPTALKKVSSLLKQADDEFMRTQSSTMGPRPYQQKLERRDLLDNYVTEFLKSPKAGLSQKQISEIPEGPKEETEASSEMISNDGLSSKSLLDLKKSEHTERATRTQAILKKGPLKAKGSTQITNPEVGELDHPPKEAEQNLESHESTEETFKSNNLEEDDQKSNTASYPDNQGANKPRIRKRKVQKKAVQLSDQSDESFSKVNSSPLSLRDSKEIIHSAKLKKAKVRSKKLVTIQEEPQFEQESVEIESQNQQGDEKNEEKESRSFKDTELDKILSKKDDQGKDSNKQPQKNRALQGKQKKSSLKMPTEAGDQQKTPEQIKVFRYVEPKNPKQPSSNPSSSDQQMKTTYQDVSGSLKNSISKQQLEARLRKKVAKIPSLAKSLPNKKTIIQAPSQVKEKKIQKSSSSVKAEAKHPNVSSLTNPPTRANLDKGKVIDPKKHIPNSTLIAQLKDELRDLEKDFQSLPKNMKNYQKNFASTRNPRNSTKRKTSSKSQESQEMEPKNFLSSEHVQEQFSSSSTLGSKRPKIEILTKNKWSREENLNSPKKVERKDLEISGEMQSQSASNQGPRNPQNSKENISEDSSIQIHKKARNLLVSNKVKRSTRNRNRVINSEIQN